MSYIVNSDTRTRTRNGYGKFMTTPDEISEQSKFLAEREHYAARIEAMRFENAKASFNSARLERIEQVEAEMLRFASLAQRSDLAYEMHEGCRLALIALSKQVTEHLPR